MSALSTADWIVGQRGPRNAVDPFRPYMFFAEEERSKSGEVVSVNTVFLTNRECPWRCLMCDLWKNTLTESVPRGAISAQIEHALSRLPPSKVIKLYNSGSFFDPRAIPVADYPTIAAQLAAYEHVIVESHPALIGENCLRFQNLLAGQLEVAMGLETVHPEILPRLNKGMTLEQFRAAANLLHLNGVDLRTFILVKPPYINESEALTWACRSLDFAFGCGATAATVIPTRGGNGAMEALAAQGDFQPPKLSTLESCLDYGIRLHKGRVFADLWDLERFASCDRCYPARATRLQEMNRWQLVPERIPCKTCGELR